MIRIIAMVLALASCDVVFRLATVEALRDGNIDASSNIVTGTYLLRYVTNDESFMPLLIETPYPSGSLHMTVSLDDGTTPTVTYTDDGSFSFPVTTLGQTYKLAIEKAGAIQEYQHTAPKLTLVDRLPGRPDRVPVTQPTTIAFSLGNAPAAGIVASTGLWTFEGSGVTVGTFNFRWDESTSLGGTLGLLDASRHDRLYYFGYQAIGTGVDEYYNFTSTFATSITQTDGGTTPATGTMTTVSSYKCAHLATAQLEEFTRVKTAVPEVYTGGGSEFDIYAVPSVDIGPIGPIWLVTGGGAVAPAADVNVMAQFVDPFPGTELLASMAVYAPFDVAVGSAMPAVEYARSRMFVELDASNPTCANNVGTVTSGVIAIATAPALAGTPIVTKDQLVLLDLTHDVPLTWSESSGSVDYTVVTLYELTNDGGVTGLHVRESISSVTATTTLDSSALASGHTYVLYFVNELGYPSAGTGNFDAVGYPNGNTQSWSQVFTVQAQ